MKTKTILLPIFLLVLTLFVLFTPGCRKEPEKKPESPSQSEKQPQPKELKQLIKNIETIIQEVEKKQSIVKNLPGDQKNSETGNNTGQDQSNKNSSPQKNPLNDWKKEEKKVIDIHKQWNSLETKAVKAGADEKLRNKFETNLDSLTDTIMNHDIMKTLFSANELYGSATEISALFKTENPPPADMLKYYGQKVLFSVQEENWPQAAQNTADLQNQWEKTKILLDEKKADLGTSLDYGITDLTRSIKMENKNISIIKGEIVLENIEKIIKEMSKEKKE